jgi:hypothetical protein
MLGGLSEAELDAYKARLQADKARVQAMLLATDRELTRVDAEQRTRERVREDVDKRYPNQRPNAVKHPDEGSVVTRRDTTELESEEHSAGRTHRKSMRLKEMSAAKEARGKGETEKGKQPAAQKKRTRTTRQAAQTQPA